MLQTRIRAGVVAVGQALREPEGFALRWGPSFRDYPLKGKDDIRAKK